jgi:ribosomal protein S18 acetylase RimI-like enzyme
MATKKDRKQITELYYQFHPERRKTGKIIPLGNSGIVAVVAEECKKLVGFCMGSFTDYGPTKYGYIEELFVKEEYRGRGIGKDLVRSIQKIFKKLNASVLCVMTERGNNSAKLYKSLGFIPDKTRWFYWKPKIR